MTGMTAGDRNHLITVAKGRAKQAKTELTEREKIQLSEIEDQLTAEFRLREEVEADVLRMAEEALAKVNEQIRNQARLMGYDGGSIPQATLPCRSRYDNRTKEAKDEARKRVGVRLAALRAAAISAIDKKTMDITEALIIGGLESDEAKALVGTLPTAEQLIRR